MGLQSLTFEGPFAFSLADPADPANVELASAALDRALESADEVALAAWARRWGRDLVHRCRHLTDDDGDWR